ncbi:unnamed protein product, partial [Rotaria socialis]
ISYKYFQIMTSSSTIRKSTTLEDQVEHIIMDEDF